MRVRSATSMPLQRRSTSPAPLRMGFFDQFFGGGGQAEANHILITGSNADAKCEQIKQSIYDAALKGTDASKGVQPEKLISAFQTNARKFSSCPSAKQGGSLGSFGRGQMVPEFDAVVFNEAVGVVHGPVKTQL